MILGPQPRRTLVRATMVKGSLPGAVDDAATWGQQRDHGAVSGRGGAAIMGLADQEDRARGPGLDPPCPRPLVFAEAQGQAEFGEDGFVEVKRPGEIGN